MPDKIYPLSFSPGIQRDGTQFSGRTWVEGRWVRFQRGLPRKIGGYKEIASTDEIVRGIFVVPNPPNFIIFYGTSSKLFALTINQAGTPLGAPVDRTPVGFLPNQYYDWQFDTIYSATNNTTVLVAFAARNLFSIANTQNAPIFYGDLLANTPLVSNAQTISGGLTVLYPYLFTFGNDGEVKWYNPNSVTTIKDSAFVAGEKIVAGLPTRGGTNSPAGILWSLSNVIRVTFTGGEGDFNFDAVSSESSILSSRSVIEYDNQYYWCATDRFLVYNGTCQELPNQTNINYFFDNLNYNQRQKVWATKVTRFGEIWWHYPSGNATECNKALIYNVRERSWYDTDFDAVIETDGRSDGYFDQTFSKPIWSGSELDIRGDYPLYMHEVGTDRVLIDGTVEAIESSITTPSMSYCASNINNTRPETDINLFISRIEPDFIISGSMDVTILAREFAASNAAIIGSATFDSTTEFMNFNAMGREIYITFTCNNIGCDFQMGQILVIGKLGDIRA